MRTPGIVILVYGLLMLGGGINGYTTARSMASLIAGGALGIELPASGVGVFRGKNLGFLMAPLGPITTFLYFALRP